MTALVNGQPQKQVTVAVTFLVTPPVEVKPENIRCLRQVVPAARVEKQRGATPVDALRRVTLKPGLRSPGLRSLPSAFLLKLGVKDRWQIYLPGSAAVAEMRARTIFT